MRSERLIEAHGLREQIRLTGPMSQEELFGEYIRADAFCLPCRIVGSDRDGIPNVLVEAMACGTPAISTGISGIPELICDGADGMLVAPDDPAALATALRRLHEDRELAARLGAAGRAKVLDQFDGDRLARAARRALPGGAGAMSAALAPAVAEEVRPRPVCCVIEHLHRNRGVADDACRGRFTELGITLELGPEPDWLGAEFPADEEWRIAFGKFYFGLDLATAFAQTGDLRYLSAWEGLVSSWIEQVPLGLRVDRHGRPADAQLDLRVEPRSPRRRAFSGLARGLDLLLLASLAAQAGWLRSHLTPARNHRTLELYALFVCALALPRLDSGGGLLRFAVEQLDENLSADFRDDGVHVEASTHYHLIVLRSFLGVSRQRAALRRRRCPPGSDVASSAPSTSPSTVTGRTAASPRCPTPTAGSYAELLAMAADELRRPDCRVRGHARGSWRASAASGA